LPEGMQMDQVFEAPATGTTDSFFEALGITLLGMGALAVYVLRRARAGTLL